MKQFLCLLPALAAWLVVGCASSTKCDLAHDSFPQEQAEIRDVLQRIYLDAERANLEGLRASHLDSDKFTKFGPGEFERQDVDQCNESEAAFVTAIHDAQLDLQDIKIDVFGMVAVATYYPHGSFKKDGQAIQVSGRQTLVFLKTDGGWKIVHEHGTPKACFEE